MNFVTIADQNFVYWFEQLYRFLQVTQTNPTLHVMDISPRADNALANAAKSRSGVVVHHKDKADWIIPDWIQALDFRQLSPGFSFADEIKYWRRRLRHKLTGKAKAGWMIDKAQFVSSKRHAISLWANKPRFFRSTLNEVGDRLIYIDVDAMPVSNLEALFTQDFDLGFTTERPENLRIGREPAHILSRPVYPYRAINTGVYCARNTPATQAFFDAWIAMLDECRHDLLDQTTVAWMLLRLRDDFFQHQGEVVNVELPAGPQVRVANMSGDHFNCYNFELSDLGGVLDRAVYHFVGAHKREDKMEQLTQALDRLYEKVRREHGR
jgi:hypothetical protein